MTEIETAAARLAGLRRQLKAALDSFDKWKSSHVVGDLGSRESEQARHVGSIASLESLIESSQNRLAQLRAADPKGQRCRVKLSDCVDERGNSFSCQLGRLATCTNIIGPYVQLELDVIADQRIRGVLTPVRVLYCRSDRLRFLEDE